MGKGRLQSRGAGEISDMGSIQIHVWGQILRCSWPHGSVPSKSPGSVRWPQANERAGGTHDAGPRSSIPSNWACMPRLPALFIRRLWWEGRGAGWLIREAWHS